MATSSGSSPHVLREIRSRDEVEARIRELTADMARGYVGCEPLLVAIAEGGQRFATALRAGIESRGVSCELALLRARRTRGTSLRSVEVEPVDPACFAGRDVLVVDDIADEGRTLHAVLAIVRRGRPRSVRTAVLVDKQSRRRVDVKLDYAGFQLDEGWVVGFGMDVEGACRDLDYLAVLEK